MECECGGDTQVIDSRAAPQGRIIRRRRCLSCGTRFSTYEMTTVALDALNAQVAAGLKNEQTVERVRELVESVSESAILKRLIAKIEEISSPPPVNGDGRDTGD